MLDSKFNEAHPAKMPAIARINGIPAAIAEPNAMNKRMSVGRPDSNSALCNAFSFDLLKSCHTAHSPVTFAETPAGTTCSSTNFISSPADSGRSASTSAFSATGINAVLPSGEIKPASRGIVVGSIAPAEPGAFISPAASCFTASGEFVIGVS